MRSEAEIREVIEMLEQSHRYHTAEGHLHESFSAATIRSAFLWVLGKESAFAKSFIRPTQRMRQEALGKDSE
jgi:hypothetical protein